ncbi:uncharacterized protein LOC144123738 [Amblyomma americanum]
MVCSFSTAGTNLPELKPYLSEHQDSFKALSQPRNFVMLQRSFEHDPGFLLDGDCIYGRMFEFYPEEKCVMGSIAAKILSLQYIFLASEYENCDLLRVPHRDNGCEMWVLLDKIDEVNSVCFFIYDLLRGAKKFVTYDQEKL